MSDRPRRRVGHRERRRPACILRREASTVSERPRRRVGHRERRRPAGILRRPLRSKESTVSDRPRRRVGHRERRRPACILRRPLRSKESTVSDRPRRRVGHRERRRPACIFSAFQALFFFVAFSKNTKNNLTDLSESNERSRHRGLRCALSARGCPLSHVLFCIGLLCGDKPRPPDSAEPQRPENTVVSTTSASQSGKA